MRLYDNPLISITYFLGSGIKKVLNKTQNAIDERDERKTHVSASRFTSSDEEERRHRSEILERREKWAVRCFIFAMIGIILCYLTIDDFPILSVIVMIPTIISVIYGLWYSFHGKYW